jgi:hypothetical protein
MRCWRAAQSPFWGRRIPWWHSDGPFLRLLILAHVHRHFRRATMVVIGLIAVVAILVGTEAKIEENESERKEYEQRLDAKRFNLFPAIVFDCIDAVNSQSSGCSPPTRPCIQPDEVMPYCTCRTRALVRSLSAVELSQCNRADAADGHPHMICSPDLTQDRTNRTGQKCGTTLWNMRK